MVRSAQQVVKVGLSPIAPRCGFAVFLLVGWTPITV